jgi:type IV pilus assembly protein PilM
VTDNGNTKTQNGSKKTMLKRDISLNFWKRAASASAGARKPEPTRHKQVVGLKIGSSQLAAALVVNNGGPRLTNAAREELNDGIVVGGEVRDPEALAAALDAFFTQNGFPRRKIRLGIGSNRVGVRVFERPEVDDPRQLANAIRFRAHEALPIPIEEAMLDYHVVDDGDGSGRVVLAVTYRELIDGFIAACKLAKLELVGIDLEAFALLRALVTPRPKGTPRGAARVAVTIGHDRTTVAVSDGRVCEFTRVLEFGGATFTRAIERTVRVEEDEAERIKRSLSLTAKPATDDAKDDKVTKATETVRREVQSLARELVSTLEFYQDQPSSLSLADVSVTGGTSHLRGLDTELEKLLGVEVGVGDPFARVGDDHDAAASGQVGSLAVAIGLGIED